MEKIFVDLENCYGINKLEEQEFDFSEHNGVLIYASNGTMKTSFAKTFLDISENSQPLDRISGELGSFTVEKISEGTTNNIENNEIFVIESFNNKFNFEKISNLIARDDLRNQYNDISNEIQEHKNKLIRRMASLSKLRQVEIEEIFVQDFQDYENNFLDILLSLENLIDGSVEIPIQEIKYKIIFNEKILNFIQQEKIFDSIDQYAQKYLELIDNSEIFEKDLFTHNNAGIIAKQLDKNNFFDVNHQISLRTGQIIKNKEELDDLIQEQKDIILTDASFKELFNEIDSGLENNAESREFKKIISNHPEIIPELRDITSFKKKIWVSILNEEIDLYLELIEIYKDGRNSIRQIIEEAKDEEDKWKEVIKLFNERFFVPFRIELENQEDVILKQEVPVIKFIYENNGIEKNMGKNELLNILSNGEKKALYLLNVIYEIEARKIDRNDVLVIVDDIADSFDYQNKYAIVEYLNDILKEDFFKLIILTHNFDFYRTVHSRLNIPRKNCFMVIKRSDEIKIVEGQYLNNAFTFWKRQLNGSHANDHRRLIIAAIPFVRNLIEYTEGTTCVNYNLLTELLHIKENSLLRKLSDLQNIYSDVWNVAFEKDDDDLIFDLIFEEADLIVLEDINGINLENKITLSIAIRLIAEDYMIFKINDDNLISQIETYQSRKLYKMFKERNDHDDLIPVLEQVNLMTPENIHMNSFMYEPILDMTDHHLKNLYTKLKEANNARNSN